MLLRGEGLLDRTVMRVRESANAFNWWEPGSLVAAIQLTDTHLTVCGCGGDGGVVSDRYEGVSKVLGGHGLVIPTSFGTLVAQLCNSIRRKQGDGPASAGAQ